MLSRFRPPTVATPQVPAWKLEDGPEGADELDLELEDLVTGVCSLSL